MDAMLILVEIVGWVGAGLIFGAYSLLSFGKLQPQSLAYQAMNVAGATGFIVNSGYHGALPNAALNIVWVGVGLFTLWRVRSIRSAKAALRSDAVNDGGR